MPSSELQARLSISCSCFSSHLLSSWCLLLYLPTLKSLLQIKVAPAPPLSSFISFVSSLTIRKNLDLPALQEEISYILGCWMSCRSYSTQHKGSGASWSGIKLWMFGAPPGHSNCPAAASGLLWGTSFWMRIHSRNAPENCLWRMDIRWADFMLFIYMQSFRILLVQIHLRSLED